MPKKRGKNRRDREEEVNVVQKGTGRDDRRRVRGRRKDGAERAKGRGGTRTGGAGGGGG